MPSRSMASYTAGNPYKNDPTVYLLIGVHVPSVHDFGTFQRAELASHTERRPSSAARPPDREESLSRRRTAILLGGMPGCGRRGPVGSGRVSFRVIDQRSPGGVPPPTSPPASCGAAPTRARSPTRRGQQAGRHREGTVEDDVDEELRAATAELEAARSAIAADDWGQQPLRGCPP